MITTVDDILKYIGEFGPYQKRIYFLLCLPSIILGALMIFSVFILGVPEHRCKIPGIDNDTFWVQGPLHESLINATIPPDSSGGRVYDRCHLYATSNDSSNANVTDKQRHECHEWVYDTTVFKYTFATQLNMVCYNAIMVPNAQMIFFFGVLIGSVIYGQLSDIIGRLKTLFLCILILTGSSVGLIGMVEYIGFCVLMFIIGGTVLGYYITCFVMGMELVGPSKRLWTGNIIHFFVTTGVMYLILMSYLIKDWTYFTLAVALPGCLFLPYYWVIPESCRWLLSKNRKKEAATILQKVAKSNGTVFSENLLDQLSTAQHEGRVWQLFSSKVLAIRTLIIFLNWFVCSMSYYGVVLNIGNLGGDFYLNFTLMTVVEFPVLLIGIPLMNRIGRKRLHIAYLLLGGVACIGTIWPILDGRKNSICSTILATCFVEDECRKCRSLRMAGGVQYRFYSDLHPVLIGCSMVGKMCVTGAFVTIYLLSAELFPTVVRNAGMGTSSALARIGSMLAPYIAKSADLIGGDNGQVIPQTFFGVAMILAGLMAILLPETMNRQLPETIEDADNVKRTTTNKIDAVERDDTVSTNNTTSSQNEEIKM